MRRIALPDVFRPTSDEDYLKGAIETANWIRDHDTVWHHGFGRDIIRTVERNRRFRTYGLNH